MSDKMHGRCVMIAFFSLYIIPTVYAWVAQW